MMTSAKGHATAGNQPVVLLRYRPGRAGKIARIVHLVPLPQGKADTAVIALCGQLLCAEQVEAVTPGHGVPCSLCLISQVHTSPSPAAATPAPADVITGGTAPRAAAAAYRAWDWPVTQHRNQVWLDLESGIVALIIPVLLAIQVTAILDQRRCIPPVLAYPDTPDHRIVLAGEPFGVVLPWPRGIHRAVGTLPLPPTTTPSGPITWAHLPQPDTLLHCREIDVFSALRAVLNSSLKDPPPGSDPTV